MNAPKLSDLEAEEALVAALLLFDDYAGLDECTDDELFYDHTRAIISTVRMLRRADKPCGTVFVLAVLASQGKLDALSWRGDTAEVLVLDILSRRVADVQAYYGRHLGRLVRYYAVRRQMLQDAQGAALETFQRVIRGPRGGVEL